MSASYRPPTRPTDEVTDWWAVELFSFRCGHGAKRGILLGVEPETELLGTRAIGMRAACGFHEGGDLETVIVDTEWRWV